RGLDPVAVLTRAERQELRRAGARDSALLRSLVEFVRRPLTVPVAGLVSAIGGVGAGSIAVTAIGTAVCVAALARRVHVSRAARRLGRELGRSLRGTAPASILDELATTLDTAAGVTWAAVVSWSEDEAAGR